MDCNTQALFRILSKYFWTYIILVCKLNNTMYICNKNSDNSKFMNSDNKKIRIVLGFQNGLTNYCEMSRWQTWKWLKIPNYSFVCRLHLSQGAFYRISWILHKNNCLLNWTWMKEVVLSILTFNVCYFLQKQYIFDGKVIVMWTRFCNAQGNFSICCSSFTLNAFYLALVIPTVVHSHIKTKRKLLYSH